MKFFTFFFLVAIFMSQLINTGEANRLLEHSQKREKSSRLRRIRDFQKGFAALSRERYLVSGAIFNAYDFSSVTFLEFSGAFIAASTLLGVGNMARGVYNDQIAALRMRIVEQRAIQRRSRL